MNVLSDRKRDEIVPQGASVKLYQIRQMAPRGAGSVTGTKMAHRPSHAGQFTYEKLYEKLYAALSKAIHLPAFFRQACGLHFWNSGGLGS